MRSVAKARVVAIALVAIALWPIAHRQLVTRYDTNPWKLYGFAMYCTPHGIVVDVVDTGGEAPRRIEPANFPPELARAHGRFVERRRTLGVFVRPHALAREVFEALPELDAITIAVRIFSLEPWESVITHRTRLYPFARKQPRPARPR